MIKWYNYKLRRCLYYIENETKEKDNNNSELHATINERRMLGISARDNSFNKIAQQLVQLFMFKV